MQKDLKTKRIISALKVVSVIFFAYSCTTMVQMQRTFPPEAELPADSAKFLFVNFYD